MRSTVPHIPALSACLCVLLVAAALVRCPGAQPNPLTAGGQLIAAGDYMDAEATFARACEADVMCAVGRSGMGAAALFSGDLSGALDSFDAALAIDSNCVSALLGRGAVLYRAGKADEAMAAYRHALAYETPCRPQIRACVGHLACMAGFYRSAEADAGGAVAEDPDCELARQTLAASYIALGRPGDAIKALGRPVGRTDTAYPGLAATSPVFSPGAAYHSEHGLDDAVRLAGLQSIGVAPVGRLPVDDTPAGMDVAAQGDGLRIEWPGPNARVSGVLEVCVVAPAGLQIDYVALLIADRFVGVSNSRPYRLTTDTRTVADGICIVRCEAYGPNGDIVGRASQQIVVANGARTVMPEELAARAELDLFLQRALLLQADPTARAQLCGHALQAAGRTWEAVDAFEYGFSYNPGLPCIRADLLLAYQAVGVLGRPSPEIHNLRAGGGPRVALTFDDGPHPVLTPVILDLLDQYGAKGTFLLIGKQAETYPELVRLIAERGHEIGNHSYSHRNLTDLSELEIERELVMTRQIVRRACGRFITLFRPPGGHYNASVRSATRATGFSPLFWNENIGNYPGRGPDEIVPSMIRKVGTSGIVLLHNGYDETPAMLPAFLKELAGRGYHMGTVSELCSHSPFVMAEAPAPGPPGWQLH